MVAFYIKSILSIFSPSSIHLIDLCSLYLSLSASSSLFFTVRLSRARKERWMRMFFPPSNCRENKVSPLVEWTRIIVSALIVMAHWQMPTYNAFKNVHIHRGKKKKRQLLGLSFMSCSYLKHHLISLSYWQACTLQAHLAYMADSDSEIHTFNRQNITKHKPQN